MNTLKPIRKQILPIAIILILVIPITLTIIGYGTGNLTFQDLGLNLLAEGVGIAITVLIIERLITAAEAQKWLPFKNLIYARLVKHLSEYLYFATPIESRGSVIEKALNQVFVFGQAYSLPRIRPNLVTPDKYEASLPRIIEKYRNRIGEAVDLAGFTLEPELMSQLIAFLDLLEDLSLSEVENSAIARQSFQLAVTHSGLKAADIRLKICSQATRKVSYDHLQQELLNTIDDLSKSMR